MKQGKVKQVVISYEPKNVFTLNLIEFDDGYKALERNDGAGSSFIIGEVAQYEITAAGLPARNGKAAKLDWIAKILVVEGKQVGFASNGTPQPADNRQPVLMGAPKLEERPTYKMPAQVGQLFTAKDFAIIAQHSLTSAIAFTAGSSVSIDMVLAHASTMANHTVQLAKDLNSKYNV